MTNERMPEDIALACGTADDLDLAIRDRIETDAETLRRADAAFAGWAAGYGAIVHDPLTQVRIHALVAWT